MVAPRPKLATLAWWDDVTLGADLGIADAPRDAVYEAMDWLLERQDPIEAALAGRHLREGGIAMFDLSSSWVEGSHCELAARGYSRDGKKGREQIEYGLLTDPRGPPGRDPGLPGQHRRPGCVHPAVEWSAGKFGLHELVMVGDRGMITSARIRALKELGGLSLDHLPARPGDPQARRATARCNCPCLTSRTWPRSPARTTPASG